MHKIREALGIQVGTEVVNTKSLNHWTSTMNNDALSQDGIRKDIISEEKITRYLDTTKLALDKLKIAPPEPSQMRTIALDFLNMAKSYYSDAKHFMEKGDFINAFAAVNYAHGWLDAAARLGLFDVDGDDQLFTLSE